MVKKEEQTSPQPAQKTQQEEYQEALLKTGIQAANLLTELIDLKIMPDPRAKEMADVAIEVIKLVNSQSRDT
ncbi:MAG: hypothetical protein WA865_21930 [Spirulinaceae cyanobacterium]